MKKPLGFATATILIVATLVLLAGGYLYWQRGKVGVLTPSPTTAPSPTPELTPLPTPENIGEWKESRLCKTTTYCFKYPPDWQEITGQDAIGPIDYKPPQSELVGRKDYTLETFRYTAGPYTKFDPKDKQVRDIESSDTQMLKKTDFLVGSYPTTLVSRYADSNRDNIITSIFLEKGVDSLAILRGTYKGPDVKTLTADPYEDILLQIASTFEFKR